MSIAGCKIYLRTKKVLTFNFHVPLEARFTQACIDGQFSNRIVNPVADFTPIISETPIPAALPSLASGVVTLGLVGRKHRGKQ
jgi:hypothetical protein